MIVGFVYLQPEKKEYRRNRRKDKHRIRIITDSIPLRFGLPVVELPETGNGGGVDSGYQGNCGNVCR